VPDLLRGKVSRRPDAERVRRRGSFVPAILAGAGLPLVVALVVALGPWQARGGEHGEEHGRHDHSEVGDAVPAVPNAAEGVRRPLGRIGPGECVNDTVVERGALRVLDCASPHRFEVYATVTAGTAPSPPAGEHERGEQNVSLCVAELSRGRLRVVAADPTVLIDAIDDFTVPAAGRRVVCAIGYNDFRQTVGHRGR
jgi:hypothetical protein